MLTEDQRREFDQLGLLRLPGAIPAADVQAMRERVWETLEAKDIRRDDPESWNQISGSFFRKTNETGAFNPMATPIVRQALDGLFGDTFWEEPPYWGGPMVTFRNRDTWEIPRGGWHLDGPAGRSVDAFTRVAVFAFLERVEPGGGGTVVAAGSHKVVRDTIAAALPKGAWSSGKMRKALQKTEPWFGDLLSKDGPEERQHKMSVPSLSLQGHPLHVIECTGAPGDVFMTHPWLFHGGAPNANAVPRQMLLQFVHERD
jgi:hypothetical protein